MQRAVAVRHRLQPREARPGDPHTGELRADDLRGRVTLLSWLGEAFALLMQGNGADVTRWTADDFHEMFDQVEKHVSSGHIRRLTGNDYIKDLADGDVLACQAYSGDVIQPQADNPGIEFVAPEEGAGLRAESLVIPNLARHGRNAERLVDHYYEPEAAAEPAAWVNYVCQDLPAAREIEASSKDEETAALPEDPLIFRTTRCADGWSSPGTSPQRSAPASPTSGTPSSASEPPKGRRRVSRQAVGRGATPHF